MANEYFDITQVDPNLLVKNDISVPPETIEYRDVRTLPVDFYGLHDPRGEAPFRRMPSDAAERVSRGVYNLSFQTAGGRIRFKTDSKVIAIHVVQREKLRFFAHMTFLGMSGFDLYRIEDGKQIYTKSFLPPIDRDKSYDALVEMPDRKMREYVLDFPLYDWVTELHLGLEKTATISGGAPYTAAKKPVVFYGSSTAQGGCACRPGTFHCALLSRWLDMDYVNLGFSGSAKGEPEMAQYLASLDPAAYVLEYDANAPSPEHLRATHEPLFQAIRAAHPDTPILITGHCAPPDTRPDERTAAKQAAFDKVLRDTYDHAIASGDRNVYYLEAQTVFADLGGADCTVDGCHPNDLGFYAMAKAEEPFLRKMLGL